MSTCMKVTFFPRLRTQPVATSASPGWAELRNETLKSVVRPVKPEAGILGSVLNTLPATWSARRHDSPTVEDPTPTPELRSPRHPHRDPVRNDLEDLDPEERTEVVASGGRALLEGVEVGGERRRVARQGRRGEILRGRELSHGHGLARLARTAHRAPTVA